MVSDIGFADPEESIRSTERVLDPLKGLLSLLYVCSSHIRARLVAARINGYSRRESGLGKRDEREREREREREKDAGGGRGSCNRGSASEREMQEREERGQTVRPV